MSSGCSTSRGHAPPRVARAIPGRQPQLRRPSQASEGSYAEAAWRYERWWKPPVAPDLLVLLVVLTSWYRPATRTAGERRDDPGPPRDSLRRAPGRRALRRRPDPGHQWDRGQPPCRGTPEGARPHGELRRAHH